MSQTGEKTLRNEHLHRALSTAVTMLQVRTWLERFGPGLDSPTAHGVCSSFLFFSLGNSLFCCLYAFSCLSATYVIIELITAFRPPLDRLLSTLVQLWLYLYPLPESVYGGRQRVVDACLSPLGLYVYMSRGHSPATGVYVCLRASTRSLHCCDFFAQCRTTSGYIGLYVGPPSVNVGRLT
jgi:hypothetical protein